MSNLRRLATALSQYAEDHDGRLPSPIGWNDAALAQDVSGGRADAHVLSCPSDPVRANSYAANRSALGRKTAAIDAPERIVLLFESNLHRPNAVGGSASLPSPPRHEGVNNLAFADGHVRARRDVPDFGTARGTHLSPTSP